MKSSIILLLLLGSAYMNYGQTKRVLLEDYTATWCGFCPAGTITSDNLEMAHDSLYICIQNHTTDDFEVADGASLSDDLAVAFYPNGTVDRKLFSGNAQVWMNQSLWTEKTELQLNETAIATVNFSNLDYDMLSRTMDVDVDIVFYSMPQQTALAINLAIVEDSIPATGSASQTNYSASIQGGANPLQDWWHNHVLRDWLAESTWGDLDVIPSMPELGVTYSKHYSYVLPNNWVDSNCYLVGTVSYFGESVSNREVLNVNEIKMYLPSSLNLFEAYAAPSKLLVYPNPSKDQFNISTQVLNILEIELFDSQSKLVKHFKTNAKSAEISLLNECPGIYFAKVYLEDSVEIIRLSKE